MTTPEITLPGIALQELLVDNEASTDKWRTWFIANQTALEVPCNVYNSGTVRGLLKHIFAVELRHSQRLRGEDVIAYEAISASSLGNLFGIHTQAVEKLQNFLTGADHAALNEIITLQTVSAGTLQASRRKLFAHILLHSMRHWAQLSTILREHGFKTDWPEDFLFSEAMR